MSWQHPTGRIPARVALVGNGVTHQDYIAECLGHNTPDTVHGRDEVWAINRGGLALRHDVLWVMDHVGGEFGVLAFHLELGQPVGLDVFGLLNRRAFDLTQARNLSVPFLR